MIEIITVGRPEGELEESMDYLGIIKVRELPRGITDEEFAEWWPRLSARERDRYTVCETKNLITAAGRTQILTYVGAASLSGLTPFAMYFAVGTFPINQVYPGDVSVQGELFRAVPASPAIVAGNTVEISTFFSTSQGNGTYTNCGLFGNNATGTSGSGTLMTHALYSYVKSNTQAITNDYIVTLS